MKKFLLFALLLGAGLGYSYSVKADDAAEKTTDKKGKYVSVSAGMNGAAVNDVIKEQLQAIRERNDRIAYELNSSATQKDFEDPQSFMRDIRRTKKSLYNHVDYRFMDTNAANDTKFHKVLLTDKYGKSSIAMFKMEQDDKGEWKTKDIIILMSDDGPV